MSLLHNSSSAGSERDRERKEDVTFNFRKFLSNWQIYVWTENQIEAFEKLKEISLLLLTIFNDVIQGVFF